MLKHKITSRGLSVAFCAVAVAAALSACGSSGSASSTSASGGSGLSAGATTARLNLAKCLRSHGINVSDSGTTAGSGAGGPGGGIFQAFRNYPRSQVEAAMSSCKSYLAAAFPGAVQTPAQRAARTAELVKYATCMRSHGVNIPDPTTSGGGPGGGFAFGAQGGSNFRALLNTPAFKTANTACASLRPKFGGGRFGGGFGGPPGGASGASSSGGGGGA